MTDLLTEVGLARSSYFYHRAKLGVADKYADVRRTMAEIFERNHCCYGYRRIKASLSELRLRVSEKVVQRLMKQEQLVAARSKRRRYGSHLGRSITSGSGFCRADSVLPHRAANQGKNQWEPRTRASLNAGSMSVSTHLGEPSARKGRCSCCRLGNQFNVAISKVDS